MTHQRVVCLASRSPRRKSLLEAMGINVRVQPPDIDDGTLRPSDVPPEHWVMALAYLKGRRVADMIEWSASDCLILAADTICLHEGRIIGQPVDAEHARSMLKAMRNAQHDVLSGVCLLSNQPDQPHRLLMYDRATVTLGSLSDQQIDAYVASGNWRGKAGGYNLAEQLAAGWPIKVSGDPATVMGLPLQRLEPLLRSSSSAASIL